MLSTRGLLVRVLSIATVGAGLLTTIEYALPALKYDLDPANELDGGRLKYQFATMVLRVIFFSMIVSIGTGCVLAARTAAERLARRGGALVAKGAS